MDAFEFHIDEPNRLLTVVMRGFWDMPTYRAYDTQIAGQLAALNRLPAPRACLVDARSFSVQPQDVAEAILEGFERRLPLYPPRTARVVGSAIGRSQAVRITRAAGHGVFTTLDEAMAWLRADGASSDGKANAA